jgi:hypothetical protein
MKKYRCIWIVRSGGRHLVLGHSKRASKEYAADGRSTDCISVVRERLRVQKRAFNLFCFDRTLVRYADSLLLQLSGLLPDSSRDELRHFFFTRSMCI